MTQDSRPWNGISTGDAGPYTDQDWHQLYRYIIGLGGIRNNVGVFLGSGTQPNDGLRVTAQNPVAAFIDVNPGAALVRGIAYINTAIESFPVAVNASGNPRIDTIVVRADYALQTCRLAILTGTPAASPVSPTLTQTPNVLWEIPIADVAVANGFTVLAQSTITPRHEWVNAPPGVYLDSVLNNSGVVLEDGDVVVWDSTADRAITTTTTADNKATAGVVRGRVAIGGYARVQTQGIGHVRVNAAVTRGNLLTSSTTTKQAAVSAGANNRVIGRSIETTLAAGLALCNINVHLVRDEDYILIRDEATSGVNAANVTQLGWRQRELDTEVFDTGGFASLASNQITLEPGTYEVQGGCPISTGQTHRARLRDTTGGVTLVEGSNVLNGQAQFFGQFTITVQSVLQVQHWVTTTAAGGTAISTGETEKYTWVYFTRKAETQ